MLKPTKTLLVKLLLPAVAVCYTTCLTIGMLMRVDGLPKMNVSFADKIMHIMAFFLLVALWSILWFFQKKITEFYKVLGSVVVLTLLYGILIEVLQDKLTTYRSFDYFDMLANTAGSLLAAFILVIFKQHLQQFKDGYNLNSRKK